MFSETLSSEKLYFFQYQSKSKDKDAKVFLESKDEDPKKSHRSYGRAKKSY